MSAIHPPEQQQSPPQPVPGAAELAKYARQTRNATVFIAWIIGVGVAIALVFGIILGIQTAKVANELNTNGGGTSSNCLSQGGTDPTC